MSNNDLGDGLADILNNPTELSPQQKAAATRKRNADVAAAKALLAEVGELVDTPTPEVDTKTPDNPTGKKYKFKKGETRWITVQKERGKGGDRAVPVSVQGKQFLVPRGVKVQVPAMVAEVLLNAEETIIEWDGHEKLDSRIAQSYPVAVHSEK